MKGRITAAAAVAVAMLVAACGGSSSSSGTTSTSSHNATATTVSSRQIGGVGKVLVDATGMALYSPDQEAGGTIKCSGTCTSFWRPLTPSGGKPTAAGGAGQLGVIRRPDGASQVTVDGRPLYTFSEDTPGHVKGNGFKDAFDGTHFTWRAVLAGGKPASPAGNSGSGGTSTSRGYGYGSGSSSGY